MKRCAYLSNFWKVRPPLVIGLKKCLKPKGNSACWDIFCQGCGACFSTSCAACVFLVHVKRLGESKRNGDYRQRMLQLNPFSDNILLFVEQNNKQRTKSVKKRSTLAAERAAYGTKFRVRFGIRGKAKQIYEPNIFQSFANEGHLIWKHFYHREEFIKQLVPLITEPKWRIFWLETQSPCSASWHRREAAPFPPVRSSDDSPSAETGGPTFPRWGASGAVSVLPVTWGSH